MTQDEPDNLDRLIDDVARGLTSGRADGAFARRVSARLEDPRARAPRTLPRAWLFAPAAVAVLLAMLTTSLLHDGNVPLNPQPRGAGKPGATVARKRDAPAESASATTAAAQPAAERMTGSQDSRNGPRAFRPQPSAGNPRPLAEPAPVAVDPLATPPIQFAALDISPLMTVMP